MPTLWLPVAQLHEVLRYLKAAVPKPYKMLYDLTAIDERMRKHRQGQPAASFSLYAALSSAKQEFSLLRCSSSFTRTPRNLACSNSASQASS